MYKLLYLRVLNSGTREHREITCNNLADVNRIRIMLRDDPKAVDISIWQGATRLN